MEMVKTVLKLTAAALVAVSCAQYRAPVFSWEKFGMDGHRVGAGVPGVDNVEKALGVCSDGAYTAPNGRVFTEGSTPAVARAMIEVQPAMARVKQVVGTSSAKLSKRRPESELSDWAVDVLTDQTESLLGRKVDFGIYNFGGIRTDMPEGEVILDDIESMFPFKNYLCYVKLKGSTVKEIFDWMAENGVECVSRVKLVVEDRKVKELLIGGEPLDPDREYGLATINFLLDGGDDLFLAKDAIELVQSDILVMDAIMNDVRARRKEGRRLEYCTDGRVEYINSDGK